MSIVQAKYMKSEIPEYQMNPFIEALPSLLDTQKVKNVLKGSITVNEPDCFKDTRIRTHLVSQLLDDFFQPLSIHLQLELTIARMIRQGYKGRNITDGSHRTHLQNGYERMQQGDLEAIRFNTVSSTAKSSVLIGCSGCGKSSTINRILASYPQAIYHEKLNLTQVVYLKIDCPHDGSLKGLCNYFFQAMDRVLGTNYERKYALKRHSIETLIILMTQIANAHALGIIIIDEIQHLSLSRSGGMEKMLNFFVTLVNVIGLPVFMVGTPKARMIFELDLRSARRSLGYGAQIWSPLKQEPSHTDSKTGKTRKSEWVAFTDTLWKHQWLQKKNLVLTEDIRNKWYDLSQGIIDIVVKLFVFAQIRAMFTRLERVTCSVLQKVYEDEFRPVHPMLEALRSGDDAKIGEYSDLNLSDTHNRIYSLALKLEEFQETKPAEETYEYAGNEQAQQLHNLLTAMSFKPGEVKPLVEKAANELADKKMHEIVPVILDWLKANSSPTKEEKPDRLNDKKIKSIKVQDWHRLDSDDLRFIYSQVENKQGVYDEFKSKHLIFDLKEWVA